MERTFLLPLIGMCALAGAGIWFWQTESNDTVKSDFEKTDVTADKQANSTAEENSTLSPFSLESSAPASIAISTIDSDVKTTGVTTDLSQKSENLADNQMPHSYDVTSLARSAMSDADFLELAQAMRSDPNLLLQLIDEFRQETDPQRRAAISRLLGEVGGDSVTLAASELIYSGDAESRSLGLELLQQIQPGNAEARNIVSTLLATEVEPDVLVDTLTTLSKPGTVDDNSRQILSDQVAFLADHEDASVRSISLNILSRWSKDGQYTEVIRNGLTDQASVVRESAAYALVGHDNVSQTLIDSLLSVAVDSTEDKRARGGAILALKGMPIDDAVRAQVVAAELEVNRIRR